MFYSLIGKKILLLVFILSYKIYTFNEQYCLTTFMFLDIFSFFSWSSSRCKILLNLKHSEKKKSVLEYFGTLRTKDNLQSWQSKLCACRRDAHILYTLHRHWKPTRTKYWIHKYDIRPFFSSFNFLTKWNHNLRVSNLINDILSFTHTCTSHTCHITLGLVIRTVLHCKQVSFCFHG